MHPVTGDLPLTHLIFGFVTGLPCLLLKEGLHVLLPCQIQQLADRGGDGICPVPHGLYIRICNQSVQNFSDRSIFMLLKKCLEFVFPAHLWYDQQDQ